MNYLINLLNIVLFDIINFYWKKILKKLTFSFSNSFLLIKSFFSKFQIEGNIIEYSNRKYHSNGYCNQWRFSINYKDGIPIINIDKIHIFLSLEDIPQFLRQSIENPYGFKSYLNTIILEILNEIINELSNRLILTINSIIIETTINNLDYKLKLKGILIKKIDNEIFTEVKEIKLNNIQLAKNIFIKNKEIIIEKVIVKLETLLYILEFNKSIKNYPELFLNNSQNSFKLSIENTDIKINNKICLFGSIKNLIIEKTIDFFSVEKAWAIRQRIELEKIELWIGNKTIKLLEISNLGYSSFLEIEECILTIGNRRINYITKLIKGLLEILKEHYPKIPKESPILTPQIRPISNYCSPNIEPLTLVSNYIENIEEDLLSSVIELREEISENFPNFLFITKLKIEVLVEKEVKHKWEIRDFNYKKLLSDYIVSCNELEIDNIDFEINTKQLNYKSKNNSIVFEPGIIIGKAIKSGRELNINSFKIFYKFIDLLIENYNILNKIIENEGLKTNETIKSIEFSNTKLIVSYNPNTIKFYDFLLGNYSEIVNFCNIENMELYFSEFKVYRPNSFKDFLKKYLNHLVGEIKNRNWETIIRNSPFKSLHSTSKYVMNIPEVYNRLMRIIS
jgi:hypothetical protein